MKSFLFFIVMWSSIVQAQNFKYMDNHSCQECHESIYDEYQKSAHAQSYFTNELHRKIADKVSSTKYSCATCHMPMANNIEKLLSGKARPDRNNKTHTDGVACFFCHSIAYVKTSHQFNINIKAKQAEGYKPTLYGRLLDPDESDKHSSVSNPIYAQNVCKGCHSHKLNDQNITVFKAMNSDQNALSCINCHMPKVKGGAEKIDKRARGEHVSHQFFGIHDEEFRKKGVEINATVIKNKLYVHFNNKMGHPLIIQPARVKFLKIEIMRAEDTLWKNYEKDPQEDKQGYFSYSFNENEHKVVLPAFATHQKNNNIDSNMEKILKYDIPILQEGDNIHIAFFVQLAKSACSRIINLEQKELLEPQLIKEYLYIYN